MMVQVASHARLTNARPLSLFRCASFWGESMLGHHSIRRPVDIWRDWILSAGGVSWSSVLSERRGRLQNQSAPPVAMSSIALSVVWPRFLSSAIQMLTMFVALCLIPSAEMILADGAVSLASTAIS